MSISTQTEENSAAAVVKPPVITVGVIGWVRNNLFNGWFNSLLTLAMLFLLGKTLPPFIRWAIIDSSWFTTSEQCREAAGACWSVIPNNIRFITFGFFPMTSNGVPWWP